MNNEANQTVLFQNSLGLHLPHLNRPPVQKVKQRVVLNCGYRQLENVPNEIGHDGAAAAQLWVEVRNVRHRHVEREIKILVPFRFAIQHRRAKALCPVLLSIAIDKGNPALELFPLVKKPSVVVQVLYANFKSAIAKEVQEFGRDRISTLGNDLKGRFDSERLIDIKQLRTKVASRLGFDIVRHEDAPTGPVWPEPHHWNALNDLSPQGSQQQGLANTFDGPLHGP